jgi:tetratricopeptide (TPR) repeat protein
MSDLAKLQELWKSQQFDSALTLVDRLLSESPECPYLLVTRGMLIQLLDHQEGPPLEEAEKAFLKALSLAPGNLEALEELAHYYDAVAPNVQKAKLYAAEYLKKAEPALEKVRTILAQD